MQYNVLHSCLQNEQSLHIIHINNMDSFVVQGLFFYHLGYLKIESLKIIYITFVYGKRIKVQL